MNLNKLLVQSIFLMYFFIFPLGVFACSDTNNNYRDHIEILDSSFTFSESENWSPIITIGNLKNNFDKDLTGVVLQVEYYDEKNNLIDTFTEEQYSMVIPSSETTSFKLRSDAAKPIEDYATQKVTATFSKLKSSCKKKKSLWKKAVISWAPLFIIIFIWLWFVKKSRGKTKKSHLEMVEELVEINQESNKQYERIANTLENISDKLNKDNT